MDRYPFHPNYLLSLASLPNWTFTNNQIDFCSRQYHRRSHVSIIPGSCAKSGGQRLSHARNIRKWQATAAEEENNRNRAEAMDKQTKHNGEEIPSQLLKSFSQRNHFNRFGRHQEENAHRCEPVRIRSNKNFEWAVASMEMCEINYLKCLPDDPMSDNHHRLSTCFQEFKQGFASRLHLAESRAQHNAEHNDAEYIRVVGVGHLVIQFVVVISYATRMG